MSDRGAKQQALQNDETMATVIHAIILQQFGNEAYEWDPTTIYLELQSEFDVEVSSTVLNRWSAMQNVMSSDSFFKRLDAFIAVSNTLSDGEPFFGIFDPATVEEVAWAVTEVSLNRELLSFSYPVRRYTKNILKQDGYTKADTPSVFDEFFRSRPRALEIRRDLSNRDNAEAYIDEQLKDLVYQLDKIPSLSTLDEILLRRSMDEFVGENIEGEDE